MTSLLTPTKLKVDHVNTSLFLSRKLNSSACSCCLAAFGADAYNSIRDSWAQRYLLELTSASMTFLHSAGGWVSPCSGCSRRKCTFLWPDTPFQCFCVRIFGSAEGYREYDCPDRLDSFTTEAIEGLRLLFELLPIKTYFIKGCYKKNSGLVVIVDEDFGYVPSVNMDCNDHGISMWE
jgi:hypothetical protein